MVSVGSALSGSGRVCHDRACFVPFTVRGWAPPAHHDGDGREGEKRGSRCEPGTSIRACRATAMTTTPQRGRHRSVAPAGRLRPGKRRVWVWFAAAAIVVVAAIIGYQVVRSEGQGGSVAAPAPPCGVVRVVTSSTFASVVERVSATMASGVPCLRADVRIADRQAALLEIQAARADVWIADDASLQAEAPQLLADSREAGAGEVLATSPIYMVSDRATAQRINGAGGSWQGLARLVTRPDGVRLTLRDPRQSVDGLIAAGDLGETVWQTDGMNASALSLSKAFSRTRTVVDADIALPAHSGEVGLVPEHALMRRLPGLRNDLVILTGSDQTALLRFAWLPTKRGMADSAVVARLRRLRAALTGPAGVDAVAAAGLRTPRGGPPPGDAAGRLPKVTAPAFQVLAPHHLDHVFATWYPSDRRANILIVVDVSGSMAARPPGARSPLIDVVRDACRTVAALLPDEAELGLWEFGTHLDGKRDYLELLPVAAMSPAHRKATGVAIDRVSVRRTGTGLYDTTLAAFKAMAARPRTGVPNHVLIFTDGRNEADPNSLTVRTLAAQLAELAGRGSPTNLTVLAFGTETDADQVAKAVKPVDGYVEVSRTDQDVAAAFVHLAAGGLHAGGT